MMEFANRFGDFPDARLGFPSIAESNGPIAQSEIAKQSLIRSIDSRQCTAHSTRAWLDDGHDESKASLEIARKQTVKRGEFYRLLPPLDDIHYVKTVSRGPSVSIHLLANDTACVTRHRFDATAGTVTAFRSGYSNAKCAADATAAD